MSAIKIARVNVSSLDFPSNKEGYASHRAAISGDGRYISFYSEGTNLVDGDENGKGDIFIRDIVSGNTSLASINTEGDQFESWAQSSTISDNGKFIAFENSDGVYLRDIEAKTTKLISQWDGTGISPSDPSISSDGRFVLYQSWKSGYATTYLYDAQLGTTQNLEPDSRSTSQAGGLGPNRISADGRYAVVDWAIVDNKTNADIFTIPHRVNEIPDISISDDSRYALFSSSMSSNNGLTNVFLFDRVTSTQTFVSVSVDGAGGDGSSLFGDISANGRYVVFRSYASNLVYGDVNNDADIFVRDLWTGNTAIVSLSAHGDQANRHVDKPTISADGSTISFISDAYNLVEGDAIPTDTTSSLDVFVVSNPFFGIYRAGSEGPDEIKGYVGNDELHGFAGNDLIDGRQGADRMEGGAGNDTYVVDRAGDQVFEAVGRGRDVVSTSVSYILAAGQEIEELRTVDKAAKTTIALTGNQFVNKIVGDAGNNRIDGGGGADSLHGGAGSDTYLVDHAGDQIVESKGGGWDSVVTTVDYTLSSGQEIEELRILQAAGDAPIDLTGNALAQNLIGNNAANVLNGGWGNDVLTGRGGADTFVFSNAPGTGNIDRITDFAVEDTIQLSEDIFAALAPGQLAASAFKNITTGKADADDRIMYKQSTGELFYDADGSGSGAKVKIAVLDNKAAIFADDFLIA